MNKFYDEVLLPPANEAKITYYKSPNRNTGQGLWQFGEGGGGNAPERGRNVERGERVTGLADM